MKRLTLYRHAKTERDSSTGCDFDRQLTEQGRADAARMGREVRRLGLGFDRILLSPARRAVETAEGAGLSAPRAEERIYNASVEQLTAIVEAVDEEVERLMLIGHNPGFERLASRLLGESIDMPTGSLLEIELTAEVWSKAVHATGRVIRFLKPKELS
jgi:phosphohistidine phosphatase